MLYIGIVVRLFMLIDVSFVVEKTYKYDLTIICVSEMRLNSEILHGLIPKTTGKGHHYISSVSGSAVVRFVLLPIEADCIVYY